MLYLRPTIEPSPDKIKHQSNQGTEGHTRDHIERIVYSNIDPAVGYQKSNGQQ